LTGAPGAGKGLKRSEETREKIRQARLGTRLSDEHRLNLAVAAIRRWAKARGEDPDAAEVTFRANQAKHDFHVKPENQVPAGPTVRHRSPAKAKPRPVQDVTVTLPDGREVTAPAGHEVGEVIDKVSQILKLDGIPRPEHIQVLEDWLARPRTPPRQKPEGPPPSLRFIDCQCFAGGFTVGATQAGFTLVHKAEEGPPGFGMAICEANRGVLGNWWEGQASAPEDWEVPSGGAQLVVGNPPCSGFSVMSPSSFRGIDSAINECMRNLFTYAAKVNPEAVIMESVTSAFKIGLPLMRALADGLKRATDQKWFVTHVIQNNLSLGGCTRRLRYFLVVTKFPFGVEHEPLKWLPTLGDALEDLRTQPLGWGMQPYTAPPTWWSHRQRTLSGLVDGHMTQPLTPREQERLHSITDATPWEPGEPFDAVLKRHYEMHGSLPEAWQYPSQVKGMEHLTREKVIVEKDFKVGGYSQTRQWRWDIPGYVMTGHGPTQVWHPDNRHLTHREAARVMGFPDDWLIEPVKDDKNLQPGWGKGISVDCGRWVCTWLRKSMLDHPGSITGTPLPDGDDMIIDVSQDWKRAPALAEASTIVYENEPEQ
jgi:site-specific DNA-cytosine methylase